MRRRKGPLFVMFSRLEQLRVGKPRQGVAVLELREDAKAGDELWLTHRDLNSLTFAADQAERESASRGPSSVSSSHGRSR